ncbi:MAG: glycosyltransferase family 2 protein [Caldilinea sp.]|uniref:glycosyltransferase family 2 protein n=1 Tax=Caldilinea sp. TaxID=2293560 RepID=UPI002C3358F4|nr:glycosyltransferase family 2 protein [Anaerolineales bacterium]HQY91346.1 glycosyltransferase family 2 protein [Caldilinea sp.]
MMATLSVIVLTLNEDRNIEACLRSVSWADEVLVVDSGSSDATCTIAQKYATKVVSRPWDGYSSQKNYAASLSSSDWILSLDADERVSPELQKELQKFLAADTVDNPTMAHRIPIRDWMFGKFVSYGSWPHQKHIRLYRRGKATWSGVVHEGPVVDGPVGYLSQPLLHYSHISVSHFIDKLNRYTEIEASEMFAQGKQASLPAAFFGALRAFLGQYVRLQGFRDGGHGLILAVMMAMYFFTTRVKLWSLWYMKEHAG